MQMNADSVNSFLDPELEHGKMAIRFAREMEFEIEIEEASDSEGGSEESDGDRDGDDQYVVA